MALDNREAHKALDYATPERHRAPLILRWIQSASDLLTVVGMLVTGVGVVLCACSIMFGSKLWPSGIFTMVGVLAMVFGVIFKRIVEIK